MFQCHILTQKRARYELRLQINKRDVHKLRKVYGWKTHQPLPKTSAQELVAIFSLDHWTKSGMNRKNVDVIFFYPKPQKPKKQPVDRASLDRRWSITGHRVRKNITTQELFVFCLKTCKLLKSLWTQLSNKTKAGTIRWNLAVLCKMALKTNQ